MPPLLPDQSNWQTATTNADGTPLNANQLASQKYWDVSWSGGSPGQGNPYYSHGVEQGDNDPTSRTYINPASLVNSTDPDQAAWGKATFDPNNGPGFSSSGSTWDPETGQYDGPGISGFFDSPLGALTLAGSATGAGSALSGIGTTASAAPVSGAAPGSGFFAAADGVGPMATGETGMAATTAALTPPAALSTGTGSGMGFLDTLGSLLKDASTTKNLISPAGAVGQQAGSVEQQRMNALIAEAKLQQQQDQNQIAKNNAVLAAPGAMAKNSVRGDVLANAQDATVSGLPSYITVPTIGGGLRPSLFSAATRNLGSQMSTQANQQMASGTFTNPALTPLPQASAFDNVLSGTALAGGFLNAASGLIPKGGASGNDPNAISSNNGAVYGPNEPTAPSGPSASPDGGMPTLPLDSSQLPGQVGIDPNELAWWQQQANGGGQ